jgi:hypothetical protein
MELFLQAVRIDQPGEFSTAAGSITSAVRHIIRLEQERLTYLQRYCRPRHKTALAGF